MYAFYTPKRDQRMEMEYYEDSFVSLPEISSWSSTQSWIFLLTNSAIVSVLQGGVIGVIAVALLIVFAVIVYAIYHRLVLSKRKDTER